MDDIEELQLKLDGLARDVLNLSRNQILVNLRFMDAALSRLTLMSNEQFDLATDGRYLAYEPMHILRNYKSDKAIPVRDYLHVILHCVFRHMFIHTLVDREAWDLACDIAVEHTISGLGLTAASTGRENAQAALIGRLTSKLGTITAEKVYRYYLDKQLSPIELAELRGAFYADDHSVWYMKDEEKSPQSDSGEGDDENDDNSGNGNSPQKHEGDRSNERNGGENGGGESKNGSEEDWKSVSERIQMDMETFSKSQGKNPAAMLQNLREVNRERYDYTEFLKKFAVPGEVMRINDEEFDYVFYTYGLSLYGNMPLIEPLEYKETKRIREFVIAIDTSGSVAGETVQKFLQKTYNILKSTESFFSKINVHIIQCDAAVQEDAKITSQEDFDEYLKNMNILGLGGTDFRPVFDYVDDLVRNREFTNLKGLIYFTDGYGTFPSKMPDYRTAFVFLDEEDNNYNVPPWAIKLILKKHEIEEQTA